mgnify:CR=1 FL=1
MREVYTFFCCHNEKAVKPETRGFKKRFILFYAAETVVILHYGGSKIYYSDHLALTSLVVIKHLVKFSREEFTGKICRV